MKLLASAIALLALGTMSGCATLRENRPTCLGVAIGTGSLLGATAGGLISGVAANHGDTGGEKNWEIGLSTGGGAVIGGLIGWGLAEAFCEEPPPPPAPVVRTPPPPPPPPPPPTQRRGG